MLRPLYISKRLGLLMLGMAFAVVAEARPVAGEQQTPAPPAKAPAKAAPAAQAPPSKAPAKAAPAATPAAPAKASAKAPAKAQAPAPKPAAKPAVKKEEKKAPAKPTEQAKKEEPKEEPVAPVKPHGRDPFLALIAANAKGGPVVLPPGKAGLQVSTVRVDGIVRSANGMIVVVTNPQNRTYFLHQGDRLFDGRVEQISMDAVTFQESGKDPFGKPVERTVVKRVYSSAGEQQ